MHCLFPLKLARGLPRLDLEVKHKEMYYTGWKFDWLCSGPLFTPSHVALARLSKSGKLKVLIERGGTSQRFFYTIRRFRHGVRTEAFGKFTLEEAIATAENPLTAWLTHKD